MPTPRIDNLESAIKATLSYFDIFDYPLTEFEIWRLLFWPGSQPIALGDVIKTIQELNQRNAIVQQNGFYFFPGCEANIQSRLDRHPKNIENWKRSKRLFSHLSQVPYFRAAALCNMFALNNQKPTSDIDVFIVARKNRMWSTRAIVTFLTWLRREWRHGDKIAERFCLSFYVTDDNLDLSFMRQEPYDVYLIYWIATLAFVKDQHGIAQKFFEANSWVKNFLPNFEPRIEIDFYKAEAPTFQAVANFEEKIWNTKLGNIRENFVRNAQLKKMGMAEHQLQNQSTRDVKISDQVLKFHENDRRAQFREQFEKKLEATILQLHK